MNDEEKIKLFRERFIHREDAFAMQWYKDDKLGYAKQYLGSCPEKPPCRPSRCPHIENAPITDRIVLMHLQGKITLATYALKEDNSVRWLCFDIDLIKGQDDNEEHRQAVHDQTRRIVKALYEIFGPSYYLVERSGSKGFHVWVFFSSPVPAYKVYSFGRWITVNNPSPDFIEVEIYPKQVTRGHDGSMIKAPLGIHKKTGVRCFFVDNTFEDIEDQWKHLASVKTVTGERLDEILKKKNVSMITTIRTDSQQFETFGSLPCVSNMMAEGLEEGCRDEGLFTVAAWIKRRGIPEVIGSTMLHEVNGKTKPPLSDQEVETKIRSVYDGDYSEFPCNKSSLDSYCSSSCRFFESKSKQRWQRFGKEGNGRGIISRD